MSQIHLLFFLRTNSLNLLVEIREEFFLSMESLQ